MKKAFFVYLLTSAAITLFAQGSVLEQAWSTTESKDIAILESRVEKLAAHINARNFRSDEQRLRHLFNLTQREFLHQYSEYADIDAVNSGVFDCLTATTLFADILSKTNFKYQIIETNHHIFIMVEADGHDVLLETTDRFSGFVTNRDKITERTSGYRTTHGLSAPVQNALNYPFNLYQPVSESQLTGLLYFNQAVKAFNAGDLALCSSKLNASMQYTRTARIAQLASALYHTAMSSSMDENEKQQILNTWKRYAGFGVAIARKE